MNVRAPLDQLQPMKFGIGQSVSRNEDPFLLRGEGRYTDDVSMDGQVYGVVVRSPYAHGILKGIDSDAAKAMKGVLAVYTAADLADRGYGPLRCLVAFPGPDGTPSRATKRHALATDRVRFVGDPVAFVVAKTADQAREAAEAVVLDVEVLPALTSVEDAVAPGAPQIYDDIPGNVTHDFHYGDSQAVAKAFAGAAHVTRLRVVHNRIVVNAMEPRAAVARFERKTGRFVIQAPSQGAFGMRNELALAMGVDKEKIHLLTGNVGGSFGMKISVFPEYILLMHAARELKKPVKWTDTRSESFLSDHHGRDMVFDAELALDAKGNFLATRFTGLGNVGAFLSPFVPGISGANIPRNSIGMYRTPLVEANSKCVITNTMTIGAYRGAGRPEANYMMERLIDTAAAEMGIDRVVLRKRNLIKPTQMPYKTPAGTEYDSGDFPNLLEKALEAADWKGFEKRRRDSRKAGKLRGLGLGCYLEVTGNPANEMGGIHFEDDGSVTIVTGTLDFGQGHWTAFAQVLVSHLGVPFEKINLVQGDSDRLIAGNGTGGSKSIMSSGIAIIEASEKVVEKGKRVAAHFLEAGVADIAFEAGRFTIAGTDRSIDIMELARKVKLGGMPEDLPTTLDVDHVIKPSPAAYPNGCHVCEVEIDPDTGTTEVVRYTMFNDFGVLINPMLVEGQMHGGVVQGIGQALMEQTVFDESGQLVTGSYMDYTMPRASDVPFFTFANLGVPARTNPLGAKGCGEAGCAGSLPSVMNAVVDAVSHLGVRHVDMPATPLAMWNLIHSGR